MEPCRSEKEYLDQIIEPARKACRRYGYLPSVLIAQACLENGYGIPSYWDNPEIVCLMKYNNMVGIKTELLNKSWVDIGLSVWPGSSIIKNTPEQYGNRIVTIKDSFRIYDNPEQSFADFLCFLTWASNYGPGGTPKYGQEILSMKDPVALIWGVSARGYATGQTYAPNVLRIINKHNLRKYDDLTGVEPTKYTPKAWKEESKVTYSNSPLAAYVRYSPNNSGPRTHSIDRITPHCYVGQVSVEDMGGWLCNPAAGASANYGIGADGRVGLYVPESKRSWCSSSSANDQRAVTIECASDKTEPFAFRDAAYQTLINLCVDICKRNEKTRLIWIPDKDKALSYTPKDDEMLLTVHRWFAPKSCPGTWMIARMGDLAKRVTQALDPTTDTIGPSTAPTTDTTAPTTEESYRVQAGAYKVKANAVLQAGKLKAAGFPALIVGPEDGSWIVQCGVFRIRENAKALKKKIKDAGFSALIKKREV